MRLNELLEAPIPDEWGHRMFSTPTIQPRQIVSYVSKRADQIVEGSARIAFILKNGNSV